MRDLIEVCMRTNVNERPSAMDIVHRLQVIFPSLALTELGAHLFAAPCLRPPAPGQLLCPSTWLQDSQYLLTAAAIPAHARMLSILRCSGAPLPPHAQTC